MNIAIAEVIAENIKDVGLRLFPTLEKVTLPRLRIHSTLKNHAVSFTFPW